MSRRVLISAALLVAALLPGTAAAAPEPGLLVVEGTGGTTIDVRIDSSPIFSGPTPEVRGGAEYAGALIESLPVDNRPYKALGALRVTAFGDATGDVVATYGGGQLAPGTYRVTLLGSGSVRVVWQLQPDDPGIRIVPKKRLPVTFLGRAETLPGTADSAARVDLPAALPAQRRALQVVLLDGAAAGDLRMCATTADACPGEPLPACTPAPVPCRDEALPEPFVSEGGTTARLRLHRPEAAARALRWSFDGSRLEPDRLRAAAVLF